jgi:hypothetical protein
MPGAAFPPRFDLADALPAPHDLRAHGTSVTSGPGGGDLLPFEPTGGPGMVATTGVPMRKGMLRVSTGERVRRSTFVRARTGRRSEEREAEERSRRLAGLVGPALIAITASEAVNLDLVRQQYRFDGYLDGVVVFLGGLSLVRGHNRWTSGWPVVLTLTGWATMLGGLTRMFVPRAPTGPAGPGAYAAIGVPFGVGVFLSVQACRRGAHVGQG